MIFFVSQSGAGANTGADEANAASLAQSMDVRNWNNASNGGSTIGGGYICNDATTNSIEDEIRFVGTISTSYVQPYATYIGTAGLKYSKVAGSKFSAAHWGGGAITWVSGAYTKNKVTVDGIEIECTDNGTLLGNQVKSYGIAWTLSSNVTIRNCVISNLYVRVDNGSNEQIDGAEGITGLSNAGAFTDILIENNVIHDVNIAINLSWNVGSARYTIRGNEVYNMNWGIGCGDVATASTMEDFLAEDNWFHDMANWDADIGFEAFHHNCIFLFGNNADDNFASAVIRNNKFGPNLGERATSAVYISSYGMVGTYDIYNNLFVGGASNGLLTLGPSTGSVSNVRNNTFVCNDPTKSCINIGGSSASAMTVNSANNICDGGQLYFGNYVTSVTLVSNYNLVRGFDTPPNVVGWSVNDNSDPKSWATWQGSFGQDADSVYEEDPLLDGDYKLSTGSPCIGAGVDLSSYFTTDKDGLTRAAPWDMGAYAFDGIVSAVFTSSPAIRRSGFGFLSFSGL